MTTFMQVPDMPSWFISQLSALRDNFMAMGYSETDCHNWAHDMEQAYSKNFVTYQYNYANHTEFKHSDWQEIINVINAKKIVILNCDAEGWPIEVNKPLQNLHNAMHSFYADVPSRLRRLREGILFVSGNLVEIDSYKKWCESIDSIEYVNIIELMGWDQAVATHRLNYNTNVKPYLVDENIEQFINKRKKILPERVTRFFTNLSRRTRIPRTYLSYKFHQLPQHWHQLSHDDITKQGSYLDELKETGCSNYKQVFSYMKQNTPFIADTTDFDTNYAETLNEDLHLESYFSVVSETYQKNWNGNSMFLSEKTFKPMLLGMPFLIYGQQGCNHYLKKLGYNLYEDLFDYSFDRISDDYERADALHDEVVRVCKMLDDMVAEERFDWAFKSEHIMRRNINSMLRPKDLGQIINHPYFDDVYERNNIPKSA